MLGEFFLCSRDRLNAELIASGPHERLPCVSAEGLTPVNIAALGEVVRAGTYDEIFDQCGNVHHEAESGESGLWDVPETVCKALLASSDLAMVAEKWVASAELQLDGWQASDGLTVLTGLAGLLGRQDETQVLWYWWSL